jgi:cytochrome c-type biogenesis protein CcmH/NrfG
VDFEYFPLLAAVLVAMAYAIGAYRRGKPRIDPDSTEYFRDRSQRLLECNKLDELVSYARDRIGKRPNQTNAHWYLARALYLQQHWSEALAAFHEVARLDPSWTEKSVTPHVRAIEARIRPKDMSAMPETAERERTLH